MTWLEDNIVEYQIEIDIDGKSTQYWKREGQKKEYMIDLTLVNRQISTGWYWQMMTPLDLTMILPVWGWMLAGRRRADNIKVVAMNVSTMMKKDMGATAKL